MTSMFESDVRCRRNHTPWARMAAVPFMKEMAFNVPHGENHWEHAAILKVHYRPAVASRMWWTIEWTGEDEQRHHADAQELGLCLWKAAEMELGIRHKIERERKTEPGGGNGPKG